MPRSSRRQPRSDLHVGLAQLDFLEPIVPSALPSGLEFEHDFLGPDEEAALIAHIDAEDLEPFRFQQWLGKRLTKSFGSGYDFAAGKSHKAEPIPGWLAPLRDRAANFADLPADSIAQALLIRYDPGAGIGWHRDRPMFDRVIGISLGAPATLRLRKRLPNGFERASISLPPRSAYCLSGEVRHEWEHSIAPLAEPRWSITFRSLAERYGSEDADIHHRL